MNKTLLALLAVSITSCQPNAKQFADEAIQIHDKIMPQIVTFDKTALRIDSILNQLATVSQSDPTADTVVLRQDLEQLKVKLEDATDVMMTWMHEYKLDSTDVDYQKNEIQKVKKMEKQFADVTEESNKKLASF